MLSLYPSTCKWFITSIVGSFISLQVYADNTALPVTQKNVQANVSPSVATQASAKRIGSSATQQRQAATAADDFSSIKWSTAASQPYTVSEAQGEVVNGKLYSFGGFDSQKSGFTPTSRAYVFDPAANTWKSIAAMPAMNGTTHGGVTHAGFTNDGKDIYFAGGYTANQAGTGQMFGTNEVWKYRVADNSYERLPDLPVVIAAGQLEYLNGKLHHIGGTNTARTKDLEDHYVLDLNKLTGGWKTLAPLPDPRQHAGSAVLGGNIYYIGGQSGHDNKLLTKKEVHKYSPATNSWSKMADLPVPQGTTGRGHISSSVIAAGNRLLVLAGETEHIKGRTNMVSAYTPATNTWENLTPMPAARYSGVAAYIGGTIFYTGGASAITYKGVPQTIMESPFMLVENQDKFPAADHLAFSRIQIPWSRPGTPVNNNHDKVKLKISNKGSGTLTINNLTLSNASAWKIDQIGSAAYTPSNLPLTIKPGSAVVLTMAFIAKDQASRVAVLHDTLYIASNDKLMPTKKVHLHGLWQKQGESTREPWAQEIINAFGFKTNIGYNHDDNGNKGESILADTDEIMSSFFVRADESRPVEVTQMAAYHGCCNSVESFKWYYPGEALTTLFTHSNLDGQSLLPRKHRELTKLAQGSFKPTGRFGFRSGSAYSDRTQNSKGKIGMRIWKAIDANGVIIPNAFIIGSDYLGNSYTNYDYQDNVYFVTNVKPEEGTAYYAELLASPSAVEFNMALAGSVSNQTLRLSNQGKTYADGGSDPTIEIKSIEITGPDKDEFGVSAPGTPTLAVQATTDLKIDFRPKRLGLKNAMLLLHHTSSNVPLRIPLYGIASSSDSIIVLAKRIKGAADESITIGGHVWEADKSYRKGSVKLDRQVVASSIAATEDDLLYQTYLSAAADLAETRYDIPVPNGHYRLRMHFVENYWTAEAARMFNITIENDLQFANLDIYKEAGYRTALVKDFQAHVSDGMLQIKFNPTVNRVAIAGIELYRDSASANVTGIEPDLETNNRLVQVYPNPTKAADAKLVVEGFASQEEVTIYMYDLLGKLVLAQTLLTNTTGSATAKLTMASAIKGFYIIRAIAPSGKAQFKVLLQ